MSESAVSRPTVLVVDDSRPVRMVLRVALAQDGYDVVEAEDGQQGLERLDGRRVHLILSDFNMPRLDGLGFIAGAKKLAPYRFVPTVIFAAGPDDPTVARARAGRAGLAVQALPGAGGAVRGAPAGVAMIRGTRDGERLRLAGRLVAPAVADALGAVRAAAVDGARGIDLSALDEIDGAGVQLLVVAARAGLALHASPDPVRRAFAAMGLEECLAA